jgi:hypothetical protein
MQRKALHREDHMTRRVLSIAVIVAAGVLAGCGGGASSCASSSADWAPTTNSCSGLAAGQAFDVQVTLCQLNCQSSPSCAVDIQQGTIQLDTVVHTCDESSCSLGSCAANAPVICHVPGLAAGNYNLLVGSADGGTVVVGGSATSCSI